MYQVSCHHPEPVSTSDASARLNKFRLDKTLGYTITSQEMHSNDTDAFCRYNPFNIKLMGAVKGGKLNALEYVRTLFGIPTDRCVAAGDSGNDILMLAGRPSFLASSATAALPSHP